MLSKQHDMNPIVKQLKDAQAMIIANHVRVKIPDVHYNKKYFSIACFESHEPLYIQLHRLVVNTNPVLYDNGCLHLDVCIQEAETNILQALESTIIQKLQKKFKDDIVNIKTTQSSLRLRNVNMKTINAYDDQGQPIDINYDISARDVISLIIHMDKVVSTAYGSYFNYSIIQLRKHSTVTRLKNYALLDIETQSTEKYEKMQKLGVPLNAVCHKMKMDGVSEDVISAFQSRGHLYKLPHATSPPPPPPPPPQLFLQKGHEKSTMSAVFADIRSGKFQLKAALGDHPKKDCKALRNVDVSRKVPTLQEIQNALKNLRRLNKRGNE